MRIKGTSTSYNEVKGMFTRHTFQPPKSSGSERRQLAINPTLNAQDRKG